MNLENLVLYVAFTMGKASSLDLSTDFCKSAFHGGLVSHMQNVLTSTGTSRVWGSPELLGGICLQTAQHIPAAFEGIIRGINWGGLTFFMAAKD